MRLVIVDYGMGNIKSIVSALKYLGVEDIVISKEEKDILGADKLLLPGVGSYKIAMENIQKNNLDVILREAVIEQKKPILGICLGMQLLCGASEEDGGAKGLSFVGGMFKRFEDTEVKVPHVGFNQVKINSQSKLFENLEDNSDFYFTHSYYLKEVNDINPSLCNYQEEFICAFEAEHIAGTQFHPELSQTNGLQLLKNFIEKF